MFHEISGDFDSKLSDLNDPLFSVLQMNYGNKHSKVIEVKGEGNLKEVDLKAFEDYKKLTEVDLSMNSLEVLKSTTDKEFSNLEVIKLSQNRLKCLESDIFKVLPRLKYLVANINELTSIPTPTLSTNILTKLELNNNRIVNIPSLTSCWYLQSLDLSKNLISHTPKSLTNNIFLTELILHSNQIESIPKSFWLPMLKILNLSMNKLAMFQISYCPMLERISIQDNQVFELSPLWGCPLLKNFDVSFNQLQNIQAILIPFSFGDFSQLQYLKFNDNPFLQKRRRWIEIYVLRIFQKLIEINDILVNELKDSDQPEKRHSVFQNMDNSMVENPVEIEEYQTKYRQIQNLIIFHQSEKAFLSRKINGRAFIGKTS